MSRLESRSSATLRKPSALSGESLLIVVNDILDFSKIEAGKLDLDVVNFDLREAVDGIYGFARRPGAQQQDLSWPVFLDPHMPTQICGDPGWLRQIINNLVGNAIKFTTQGEVVLSRYPRRRRRSTRR